MRISSSRRQAEVEQTLRNADIWRFADYVFISVNQTNDVILRFYDPEKEVLARLLL